VEATPQIFLSYAREDAEEVEQLYQKLSGAGFKPWMDKKDILPGERWQSSIRKAVQGSDFFLACLSASSVTKRGVLQEEIKDALDIWRRMFESDIYLIPVRLEDCKVPESLRDFQWVNLFEKDGWTRLVKAIQVGMERRTASAGEAVPRVSLPDLKQIRTQELYEQGINALITGKWEKAITSFEQVIEINKHYKDAKFRLEEAQRQRERALPPVYEEAYYPRPRLSLAGMGAIAAMLIVLIVGLAILFRDRSGGTKATIATPSKTPTDTPIIPTATSTNTPFPPTATPTSTSPPTPTPIPPTLMSTPTDTPLPPTATPISGGRVAFVSERDGNAEIYVMNADGSDVTRLTDTPAVEWLPIWSPDGTRIAFYSYRDDFAEIYVMNADGSGQMNLTNNPASDWDHSWAPDGTRIAFTSKRDGNEEIYVMNTDGSDVTRLTKESANDWRPSWAPDGTRIAFTSKRDGNPEIYVMNADGSNQTRMTNNPAGDYNPTWSPDGRRIAFDSDRDGNREIYVMNADSSDVTRLTNILAWDEAPSWLPDGGRIAFQSYRDGNWEIYVMNADGSGQMNLTNNPASDRWSSWSPR
jgi:Tol biopolymer transport system component